MTTLQPKVRETACTVETMDFLGHGTLTEVDVVGGTAKFEWTGLVCDVSFKQSLQKEMASFDGRWVRLTGFATFDEVERWMQIEADSVLEPDRWVTADEILSRPPDPETWRRRQEEPWVCVEPFDVDDFLEAIYESSRGRSWKESKVS